MVCNTPLAQHVDLLPLLVFCTVRSFLYVGRSCLVLDLDPTTSLRILDNGLD